MKEFILGFMSGVYVSTIVDVKPYVEMAEKETIKGVHIVNEYFKKRYEETVDKKDIIDEFEKRNRN